MKFPFCGSKCFPSFTSETAIDESLQDGQNDQKFRLFPYDELNASTKGFQSSNKIGEGAFGSVYKGRLQDGTLIAVKVVSVEKESMRGEREFVSELAALSNVQHENLVTLIGCCINGDRRYLVYNYMEKNSLAQTLLGGEQKRMKLSWEARKNISVGVARGLAYLHEEVEPHIVHRDIKASNILLTHDFTPKVADFGLSKLLRENKSYISTRVAGTLGYLAPEYAITGHLTRKSDVYSYGVVVLEIISGRPVVVYDLEHGEHYLVQKAWEVYKSNNLDQLVDSTLGTSYSKEEAIRFLKVGLLCVQEKTRLRPQMSAVIKMLSGEVDINDDQISQPGLVSDLMDIKMGRKSLFENSKESSTTSTQSAQSTIYF